MNYPWHETQWTLFLKQFHKQTLPHALLLHGPSGLGKKEFAIRLARAVLCEQFTTHACEQCHGCRLLKAGNHPDFSLLEPEEKSIGIAEIRELILQLQFTQHSANYKVVIIHPASSMTHAACNALLKSLEEPPAVRTLLILVTDTLSLLPATIVSRCQRMNFSSPTKEIVLGWLTSQISDMPAQTDLSTLCLHYNNAPLKILAALKDNEIPQIIALQQSLTGLLTQTTNPIMLAREWQKFSLLKLLDWIIVWGSLQIKQQIANQIFCQRLFYFMEEVGHAKQIVSRQIALNQQLLLEALFIKCGRVIR